MKKLILLMLTLVSIDLMGQNGSAGNPFTALGHAYSVPSSGIYYFDIDGTSFSTYVEADDGWILIASGNEDTDESSYSVTGSLTLQSDQILSSSIYASALITGVRMNATSGPELPFDVQSVSAAVLDNLRNDITLSSGTNSSDWTGTGTSFLTRGCPGNRGSLRTYIYHACGIGTNMHWQVGVNPVQERVSLGSGAKNDLNLWIRADQISLPVEIIQFKATGQNGKVNLRWQTASETNNDYFTIEKSKDGRQWEAIGRVKGAGNATIAHNYSFQDERPSTGVSYYRLKQTDFDGQFSYSSVQTVRIAGGRGNVNVFPNPTYGQVTLEGNAEEMGKLKVLNMLGQEVYPIISKNEDESIRINLSSLAYGVYTIQTSRESYKIIYKK